MQAYTKGGIHYDAVRNSAEIRRLLSPLRLGTPYKELRTRLRYGLLAHSHVWQSKGSTPLENIDRHLHESEERDARHPKEVLDIVCVSDLATWNTIKSVCAGQDLLPLLGIRYGQLGTLWGDLQKAGGVLKLHIFVSVTNVKRQKKKSNYLRQ